MKCVPVDTEMFLAAFLPNKKKKNTDSVLVDTDRKNISYVFSQVHLLTVRSLK